MKSLVVKRSVINCHKTTNGMLRTTAATVICALSLTTSFPNAASAWYPPPPPKVVPFTPGASAGAGVAATGGFIGFVAVLVGYDLLRRSTCVGDFLGLGGPGLTTPITPASGNVMIPQCPIVKKEPVVGPRG